MGEFSLFPYQVAPVETNTTPQSTEKKVLAQRATGEPIVWYTPGDKPGDVILTAADEDGLAVFSQSLPLVEDHVNPAYNFSATVDQLNQAGLPTLISFQRNGALQESMQLEWDESAHLTSFSAYRRDALFSQQENQALALNFRHELYYDDDQHIEGMITFKPDQDGRLASDAEYVFSATEIRLPDSDKRILQVRKDIYKRRSPTDETMELDICQVSNYDRQTMLPGGMAYYGNVVLARHTEEGATASRNSAIQKDAGSKLLGSDVLRLFHELSDLAKHLDVPENLERATALTQRLEKQMTSSENNLPIAVNADELERSVVYLDE